MSTVVGNLRAILGLDSSAFQNGLQQATGTLRSAGQSMQNIGRSMSAAVTAPLVGFGALSLRAAGNFEASMNRVRAASGASVSEMQALEAIALTMGETTQFSATQAADAIEILAKNGLDASQILGGALEASMLLAASSGAELAGAGDLATDVMLNFGKTSEELTGLVDGMTGVLLASKFGFDDYRLAIAQAGGVAGGLGVSFEDFNAAIAGTSAAFASGSDAGTSFKTFIQRLVPASGPAAEAMRDLNLEFFTADGAMKSMAEIAQELQDGLAGLSDEARNDALSTIFGTDALRTAIGLAEQGADGIERLKTVIGDASAEEQAAARMEGFNGEMLKLKSAVEGLMIAIGNSGIIEWATAFAEKASEVVLRLKETDPEMLKFGVAIAGIAAALGPIILTLGLFAAAIGAIGLPVVAAVAGIAAVGTAIYAFKDDLAAGIQAVTDFATGMRDRFNQLSAESGGWAQAIVQAIINGLALLYQAGVDAIANLARGMREGVTGLIDDAASWGRDVAAGLAGGVTRGAGRVRDAVGGLAQAVKDRFTGDMEIESPSKVFARFGMWISEGLANGITAGEGQAKGAMQSLADGVAGVLSNAMSNGGSIGDGLRNMVSGLLGNTASGLFKTGMSSLLGMIPGFATGTNYAPGGLARVNELGGEIIKLPRGSQVIPHDLSKAAMQSQAANITYAPTWNIGQGVGREELAAVRAEMARDKQLFTQEVQRAIRNPRG